MNSNCSACLKIHQGLSKSTYRAEIKYPAKIFPKHKNQYN